MLSTLVSLLILCAIIGVVWYITTLIPMPAPIRTVANIAVALIALVMPLGLLGVVPGMRFGHLPR